jgi:toxin HigB-1
MIRSFADKDTANLFADQKVKGLAAIERPARRKLQLLHTAQSLHDLLVPPGNRLEALKGDRKGQYAIRIDRQWRICFRWELGDAFDVEVVDYH